MRKKKKVVEAVFAEEVQEMKKAVEQLSRIYRVLQRSPVYSNEKTRIIGDRIEEPVFVLASILPKLEAYFSEDYGLDPEIWGDL